MEREKINTYLNKINECHPEKAFEAINDARRGMVYVIGYLYREKREITFNELSKKLDVSTARITKLLQKLVAKGYINKRQDKNDKRKIIISLTDRGNEIAKSIEEKFYETISDVIDYIGIDDINKFIEITTKISNYLDQNQKCIFDLDISSKVV
ncbi:MAG: MarR family transcriptional regulator [bacterium]|nr:MarR family transcriptional regulator [bacterium]